MNLPSDCTYKILVLSGGGSHGAYQLGVLKCLIQKGKSWDAIAGVSVGALNGTYLAMHNKEEISKGVAKLENIWLGIRGTFDVVKPWMPSALNYPMAYFKGSFGSSAPLFRLIQSEFDLQSLQGSNVELKIGAVALGSGLYRTVDKMEPEFAKWVLASAAIPLLMPPVEIEGEKWIDGGLRNQTPLVSIFDLVMQESSKGKRVEVDVVLTGPVDSAVLSEDPKKITSLLGVALRTAEIAMDEIYLSELHKLQEAHVMTIYEPDSPLPVDSMSFNPDSIRLMLRLGYEETLKKVSV